MWFFEKKVDSYENEIPESINKKTRHRGKGAGVDETRIFRGKLREL